MRKENSEWSVRMLVDFESRINVEEEFQRGKVWSTAQQALLIDSILRGFDIPKIYFHRMPQGDPYLFSVIDGKQRLTAIWRFFSDGFRLLRTEDFPDLGNLSGMRWSDLPSEAQDELQFASISVSKIEHTDSEEIRELFLRLQKGERLNSAEKRNAMDGPVHQFVLHRMVTHSLWPATGLSSRRFGIHEHSAILLALVRKGGPTAIKSADLEALYEDKSFDPAGPEAERTIALLDLLQEIASSERGAIRTRWGLVDLALSIMRLEADGLDVPPVETMTFFQSFEQRRREVAALLDELQTELVEKTLDESSEDGSIDLPPVESDLLAYHLRFAREGATEDNIRTRSNIMYQRLADHLNRVRE